VLQKTSFVILYLYICLQFVHAKECGVNDISSNFIFDVKESGLNVLGDSGAMLSCKDFDKDNRKSRIKNISVSDEGKVVLKVSPYYNTKELTGLRDHISNTKTIKKVSPEGVSYAKTKTQDGYNLTTAVTKYWTTVKTTNKCDLSITKDTKGSLKQDCSLIKDSTSRDYFDFTKSNNRSVTECKKSDLNPIKNGILIMDFIIHRHQDIVDTIDLLAFNQMDYLVLLFGITVLKYG